MLKTLFLFTVAILPLVFGGCTFNSSSSFPRNPDRMVSRQQTMEAFDKLELNGNFSVKLKKSETHSISIRASEEVMPMLLFEVEKENLVVRTIGEQRFSNMPLVELIVESPLLKKISCSGSVELFSDSMWVFDTLLVESAGVLKMNLGLYGEMLQGQLAGASSLHLSGQVKNLQLEVPGAAKIEAFELTAEVVNLEMAGAGKAQVTATKSLSVNLAGAGTVSFKGSPDHVFSNISGIGRVKKAD